MKTKVPIEVLELKWTLNPTLSLASCGDASENAHYCIQSALKKHDQLEAHCHGYQD